MTQDELFAEGEGDRWFSRNAASLADASRLERDPVLQVLALTGLRPQRVLEIGASNGYRLEQIRLRGAAAVVAVEPSAAAIEDGQRRYPEVRFHRAVAGDLPTEFTAGFDLVVLYFVLHWVDRSTLLRTVAEVDRVTTEGGYVVIGDFYPSSPERTEYHHLPGGGVSTFKQNYADVFVASNLYETVASLAVDHATNAIGADIVSSERAQVTLLRKTLQGRYPVRSRSST